MVFEAKSTVWIDEGTSWNHIGGARNPFVTLSWNPIRVTDIFAWWWGRWRRFGGRLTLLVARHTKSGVADFVAFVNKSISTYGFRAAARAVVTVVEVAVVTLLAGIEDSVAAVIRVGWVYAAVVDEAIAIIVEAISTILEQHRKVQERATIDEGC